MNDSKIEYLLRQSIDPQPPDGMRERVLRNARLQLKQQPRWRVLLGWKPVLVLLTLLVIMMSSVDEHARNVRLSALIGNEAGVTRLDKCMADFSGYQRYVMAMNGSYEMNNWTFEAMEAKLDDPCTN